MREMTDQEMLDCRCLHCGIVAFISRWERLHGEPLVRSFGRDEENTRQHGGLKAYVEQQASFYACAAAGEHVAKAFWNMPIHGRKHLLERLIDAFSEGTGLSLSVLNGEEGSVDTIGPAQGSA